MPKTGTAGSRGGARDRKDTTSFGGGGGGPAPAVSSSPVPSSSASSSPAAVAREVGRAYMGISGGRENVRVYLSDLRDALPHVSRVAFDAALRHMAENGEASLYRLDNPLQETAARKAGMWRTPSGEERHIMYYSGRGG